MAVKPCAILVLFLSCSLFYILTWPFTCILCVCMCLHVHYYFIAFLCVYCTSVPLPVVIVMYYRCNFVAVYLQKASVVYLYP